MEENKDLEMSLFDEADIELNIDASPDDYSDYIDNDEKPDEEEEEEVEPTTPDESSDDDKNNKDKPSEEDDDSSSEEVTGEDDDEGGDDNSPNLYSSLASVLHEQGLLPSLDLQSTKIESIDDVSAALRAEIDNNVKTRLTETLGEEGYEAVINGVPLEKLAEYKQSQAALDTITEDALTEDPELSKKIIYQDYINQGISEDRAKKMLKRIIDSGDDAVLEDARESLQSIKTFEQKKLQQIAEDNKKQEQERAKQQEELDNQVKNKIYNSEELIKGLKLNKTIQDQVYRSMTEIVGKNQNGVLENKLMKERRENPIEFDTKLYYLYEITKGFKDLSKIVNTTKSSSTAELERAIRSGSKKYDAGTPTFLQDGNSYLGGDDVELVMD